VNFRNNPIAEYYSISSNEYVSFSFPVTYEMLNKTFYFRVRFIRHYMIGDEGYVEEKEIYSTLIPLIS
jgi:hypothetical protein